MMVQIPTSLNNETEVINFFSYIAKEITNIIKNVTINEGDIGTEEKALTILTMLSLINGKYLAYKASFTYDSSDRVIQVDVYNYLETEKLYTKTISYNDNGVSKITIYDEVSGTTLTKQYSYTGNLISGYTLSLT